MSKRFRFAFTAFALLWAAGIYTSSLSGTVPVIAEAPAGFDGLTNGTSDQATFDADRAIFEERDDVAKGLGPVYNAQSCAECHQSPITGAISQITEMRAGSFFAGIFTDHPRDR